MAAVRHGGSTTHISKCIWGMYLSAYICIYHWYLYLSVCTWSGKTWKRYRKFIFHIVVYLQWGSGTRVKFDSAGGCSSPDHWFWAELRAFFFVLTSHTWRPCMVQHHKQPVAVHNITIFSSRKRQFFPGIQPLRFGAPIMPIMRQCVPSELQQHVPAHMTTRTGLFLVGGRQRAGILKRSRPKIATFHRFVFGIILN